VSSKHKHHWNYFVILYASFTFIWWNVEIRIWVIIACTKQYLFTWRLSIYSFIAYMAVQRTADLA